MASIIKLIWGFIGPTLVNVAVTMGLPEAAQWLKDKGVPSWIVDPILEIVKSLLGQVQQINANPTVGPELKSVMMQNAFRDATQKAADHIVAGPPTLVN